MLTMRDTVTAAGALLAGLAGVASPGPLLRLPAWKQCFSLPDISACSIFKFDVSVFPRLKCSDISTLHRSFRFEGLDTLLKLLACHLVVASLR